MDAKLTSWVETVTGGTVTSATRSYGGGSREMYFVDVARPGRAVDDVDQYVLRVESGTGQMSGTEVSLAREAAIYRALRDTDVPVARIVAVTDDGNAFLMAKVEGSDDLSKLSDDERSAVFDDFMRSLAKLHNTDVATLDLGPLAVPTNPEDHARLDLNMWRRVADQKAQELDPLSWYAFEWMDVNAPTSVQRTVLVHGDSGPGNFMAHDGHVSAIVDWELAHVGDPMEDFAWIDMRGNSRAHPMTAHYDVYFRETGLTFDPAALLFYRIAVYAKCAVITQLAVEQGGGAIGFAPYLISNTRYQLLVARALTDAMGLAPITLDLPAQPPTERTALFDRAMGDLRA
ncbi:MAG: phosphotransferase family protein, partial [Acidimicrobiales bacterium]|nr:phosphotransferase family protein [Acidimicrobiales bacterium]